MNLKALGKLLNRSREQNQKKVAETLTTTIPMSYLLPPLFLFLFLFNNTFASASIRNIISVKDKPLLHSVLAHHHSCYCFILKMLPLEFPLKTEVTQRKNRCPVLYVIPVILLPVSLLRLHHRRFYRKHQLHGRQIILMSYIYLWLLLFLLLLENTITNALIIKEVIWKTKCFSILFLLLFVPVSEAP